MKELLELRGIYSTVSTPYTKDNRLDIEALEKEIDFGIKCGVSGFLCPSLASEVEWLDTEERNALTKTVLEVSKGRALVIAGVYETENKARVKAAEKFLAMGCDGINLCINGICEEDYFEGVRQVDEIKPPYIIIQDNDDTGTGMRDEFIVKLFNEIETMRAVKVEVQKANPKYTRLLEATSCKMTIIGGSTVDHMLEGLDRGVHAFMPTGIFPLYAGVMRLYFEGKRQAAEKLFWDMLPLIVFTRQMFATQRFQKKLFCHLGIFKTEIVRNTTAFFDSYHERYSKDLIKLYDDIVARLDSYK